MEPTLEDSLKGMRTQLKELELRARAIAKCALNSDPALRAEQLAQSMLAVRAIEDARMRLGKVIQYGGDGISCYDRG